MNIDFPKKLKILSYYLPSLYIVGGYIRNKFLGLSSTDIDVCGEYTVDEVERVLSNTEFQLASVNKRLGTVKIYSKEDKDFSVEYTTFRVDSYPVGSGAHAPTDVVFTKDIEKDCFRRDFSVNALYFDIHTAKILDFTGGIQDIERKILRTTRAPEKVFAEDGLRILRLVRFASELGFEIENDTFEVAKKMSYKLLDISEERIRDEFMKILVADTRYNIPNNEDAHLRGVRLLDELGAIKYILPVLLEGKGMAQNPKYHIYDVFEHSVQTMYYCPPHLRLAGLVHDIGKAESQKKYGNMYAHGEIGVGIAKRVLGNEGLKFPNRDVNKICRLIGTHMYNSDGETSEKKLKMFIIDNIDILDDIVALKRADAKATKGQVDTPCISADKIESLYNKMKNDGTPLCVGDLQINGNDLIGTKIPEDKRAWAIKKVLEYAVNHPECRTREEELRYLKGLNYGNN